MSEKGIHYLAYKNVRERLEQNAIEFKNISSELSEARKAGDLRENSEFDAANDAMTRVTKERDMLTPALDLPILKANDNANVFEEGCVVDLKVYNLTDHPLAVNGEEFKSLLEADKPVFKGLLMLGGTLPIQELLKDGALSSETAIGSFLIGKQPNNYSVKVPGGFANISAKKVKSTEFEPDDIGCEFNG